MWLSSLAVPFALVLSSLPSSLAVYQIDSTFSGTTFFDNFNFFTAEDPTNGFVDYVNRAQATSKGLIKVTNGVAYLGVDSKTVFPNTAEGRTSVRIQSKKTWTQGLFIADIKHMPARICGTWPAFWSLGSGTWPTNGEIDIIEGVNKNTVNQFVLHTANSCQVDGTGQTGTQISTECSVPFSTSGCAVQGFPDGYGDLFNSNGGGVYAMEWTGTYIRFWFFPRASIPSSILSGKPDPTQFGTPVANYQGSGCDFQNSFKSQRLVFNTAFCGDWAGNVYDVNSCPSTPGASAYQSCINHVAAHPKAFAKAYWEINSVKVYKNVGAVSRIKRGLLTNLDIPEEAY